MAEFKPNIYPVMYWGIAYGAIAGILLFLLNILANAIAIVWVPVFLAALIIGGWRNWRKQKNEFYGATGQVAPQQSPVEEFKQAARDIAEAGQELAQQESTEINEQAAATEISPPYEEGVASPEGDDGLVSEEPKVPPQQPPTPPQQPPIPPQQ